MAEVTPRAARVLGRRALLRNGLLAGAGAAVASVALPGITGTAQASIVEAGALGPLGLNIAFSAQTQWWWCRNCSGLFYSASGAAAGSCPFNGYHDPSASWMYETPVLTYQDVGAEQEQAQPGWLWCNWCQGLFFGKGQPSHCPGNLQSFAPYKTGPHNGSDGSDIYLLPYSGAEGGWSIGNPPLQSGWLWCKNCQGLFHASSGTSAGLCPALIAPGQHNGSDSYQSYYLFHG
jgi:hypothetical protein